MHGVHQSLPFRRLRLLAFGFLALCFAAGFQIARLTATDWRQWNGNDRNAITQEQGLLKQWPAGGPPLAWRINGLGGGDSAPAVAAGRLYGLSSRDGKEIVWALSEKDGKEIWATSLGPAASQDMPQSKEGPGGTPTVEGDRLYAIGMSGRIVCLNTSDGKINWQRSFTDDFGGEPPAWSFRESPLIDGDKLICTPGAKNATLAALNKLNGQTIWQCKFPASDKEGGGGRGRFQAASYGAAYSSPIAIDFEGQRQYVQLTAKALVGVSAADGTLLWQYKAPANGAGINCTSPVYHDGKLFASSAYGAGGGLIKLTKEANGKIKPEEIYFSKRMQNHHGGIIVVDGALVGANGGNEGGALICLDFETGKVLWDERSKRRALKGSICLADGRIFYRTEDGPVLLIEPSRKEYLERGRFEQPDRSSSPAWAHPVVANGKLYIRDQDLLLCYDVAAK